MTLDYDEALALLTRAVEEFGEDYVYQRPVYPGMCHYYSPGAATPRCIIGQILHYLGIPDDALLGEKGTAPVVCTRVGVHLSARAEELLASVQRFQDKGIPWGRAVKNATSGALL